MGNVISESERLAKAALVECDDGMETMVSWGDEILTLQDLFDRCESEEITLPEFVFATKFRRMTLDIGDLLEWLEERMEWDCDWGEVNWSGVEELKAACETFTAANPGVGVYWEDPKRKIAVTP